MRSGLQSRLGVGAVRGPTSMARPNRKRPSGAPKRWPRALRLPARARTASRRRARAGDRKSRLVRDLDQALVVAEIFDRYPTGWGFKEIANHLNRPGGPQPPRHVDSTGNTAAKWSKTTIRAILGNPVYTGRLYWNWLDFRQAKLGEGPVVRRAEEEWVESQERHEAIVPDDWFERAAARGSPTTPARTASPTATRRLKRWATASGNTSARTPSRRNRRLLRAACVRPAAHRRYA
jgi:hypothetical protein